MSMIAKQLSPVGPGVILAPVKVKTVIAEGLPVATLGDAVSPHGDPPHSSATIVGACSATVFAEGQPVAKTGSIATCQHTVASASTIFVGP
tara:strand:- start:402 stop:674 length:273 start_codon:yes stop_codon:yes gene_type:complete